MKIIFKLWAGLTAITIHFSASAAPIAFTIDSTQSSLTLTPDFSMVSQYPGSLTTSLGGTLVADLGTRGKISFPGGSNITFAVQTGPFQPASPPAQFAGLFLDGAFLGVYGDMSDLTSDLTGQPISLAADGNFSLASDSIWVLSGEWYNAQLNGAISSQEVLAGGQVVDTTPALGLLVQSGNKLILTVPLLLNAYVYLILPATFTGQIVAYATIPEPSTVALAIGGIACLASRYRRRLVASRSR